MKATGKRPLSVTIISWLFIAAGLVGLTYHVTEFAEEKPFQYELIWILFLRLLAIICGVYMLRGHDWARWVLLAWIAYHVILSAFHSLSELVMHTLLLVVVAYFLLRPEVSEYFRGTKAATGKVQGR